VQGKGAAAPFPCFLDCEKGIHFSPIWEENGLFRNAIALVLLTALCTISAPTAANAAGDHDTVQITYLGNAGWQIEDGSKIILVDPYITQFRNGGLDNRNTNDESDPILVPHTAGIDAKIHRADYILITHGHPDHMIDAPYIAKKAGATIICHESAANVARAYDVPEDHIIIVRGGEDYSFDGFSLRVIPSLHSPLWQKHYNNTKWAGSTPPGLKAPLHESAYVEGGDLIYLLRIGGHKIFIMGSMNYIEREVQGLDPDIAIVGAGASRKESYDYAGRLMRALGYPTVVFPTHWDSYGNMTRDQALKGVQEFAAEIKAASPKTRVIIPEYFVPQKE
jgi:L-ascorbate metabolism protein UlaG (beta-lactamase superfamily)